MPMFVLTGFCDCNRASNTECRTGPGTTKLLFIAQIIMSATGTGTWSLGSGSAGTADIGSPTNPNTDVYNFSNLGYYYMVWTNSGGCRDTATLFVNDACTCPISDNLVDAPSQWSIAGLPERLLSTDMLLILHLEFINGNTVSIMAVFKCTGYQYIRRLYNTRFGYRNP